MPHCQPRARRDRLLSDSRQRFTLPPPMRIALFTETFIPKVDGIVTTLCQTIRQLRRLGYEVLVVAPAGGFAEFDGARIAGMKGRPFALYQRDENPS